MGIGKANKQNAPSKEEIGNLLNYYNAANFSMVEMLARELVKQFPDHPFGWKILGVIFGQSGIPEQALEPMRQCVRLNPYDAEAHSNLGNALVELGRFIEAEASCREAIRFKPTFAQAHGNLGVVLHALGRFSEAEASCLEAIRLAPDYARAHYNLGNALKELGRLIDAEASYREAIRLKPDFADAHYNLCHALEDLGRLIDAEASCLEAIRLKPDYAEAKFSLSLQRLLQSDFDEGLQLYEWRWEGSKDLKLQKRNFKQALWSGNEPIKGKTLLIHAEQGLGDTIQFCRYIKLVQQLGAEVIFEAQAPLVALLSHLDGISRLIPKGTELPAFDYHCPLLSLPLAFKTNVDSIPASIPYLSAESDRENRWKERLGQHGYKIGICWQGKQNIKGRSVPIEYFYALSQIPKVRLISLHKGDGEQELDSLPEGMQVETLGSAFDSTGAFLDTAAVIKCCDLVITIDTSVAHLAGALGVRTWVALKFSPDWRWLLDRSDSPWYPTMRLFRQKQNGEWQSIFDEMTSMLKKELSETEFRDASQDLPQVPISWGELIDKVTILEIKAKNLSEANKLTNVEKELRALEVFANSVINRAPDLVQQKNALYEINQRLWDIEDAIRHKESEEDFGAEFIELARMVYKTNDRRATIKREINQLTGSAFFEEKY